MITIVGLGNPGEAYAHSRHNVGWIVLEYVMEAQHFPQRVVSRMYSGAIAEGTLFSKDVRILFPHTFMNNSGAAVKKCLGEGSGSAELVVVADDIDIPLGDVKVSFGRGSGGHNGVQSIIDTLGTKDFIRIRVGVGTKTMFGTLKRPKGEALSNYVLGEFKKGEEKVLVEVGKKVDRALEVIIQDGIEKAMSEMN